MTDQPTDHDNANAEHDANAEHSEHASKSVPIEPTPATPPTPRHTRKCTAHKRNGQPCERWAIAGGRVCPTHGGRASQVRRKARQRLEEATDRMAKELLRMAVDPDVSDAVKLRAITEALDRGNVSAKTEIEISASPLQQIEESAATTLEITSRAAYRAAIGTEDETAETDQTDNGHAADPLAGLANLAADDLAQAMRSRIRPDDPNVIDAETVEIIADVNDYDEPRDQPGGFGAAGPLDGPMTLVEANEVVAELRRRNAERARHENRADGHARITPMRRALPPGRSR